MTLSRVFAPRSIAVFGASATPMSFGWRLLASLERLGYTGGVYPINPRHDEILGRRCYPDLGSIPTDVDVIAFCVGNQIVDEQFAAAARRGVGAAVVYDTGFADAGPEGVARERRLIDIAQAHGMDVVGPNCMGVLSPATRSTTYSGVVADSGQVSGQLSGNVACITQSGAIAVGLLTDCRRYGFSHIVSTGNEAVTRLHDFMNYLIDDPSTRVIALFIEAIRDIPGFTASLDRAAAAGKPVVVLKVGQSVRSKRAIRGHTGAVAGAGEVFSALLRRHRAIEVQAPDELAEVLAACQSARLPKGPSIGVVTASGGQVDLFHDVAARHGIPIPELAPATRERLAAETGIVTLDGNPIDAWGSGDWRKNLPLALELMGNDPGIDNVVFTSDTNDDQPMVPTHYGPFVAEAASRSEKPHFLFNTRTGQFRRENEAMMRAVGVGVVTGIRQAFGAICHLGNWAQAQAPVPLAPRISEVALIPDFSGRTSVNEYDTKQMLRSAGLTLVREQRFTDANELADAAAAVGYPAVLKVCSDQFPHRSDLGFVRVGLHSEAAVRAAFGDFQRRLDALKPTSPVSFLLAEQVTGAVEVFAGIRRDPELGPSLFLGPGGVLIELMGDVAVRPLPLCVGDVEAMLRETRLERLLAGLRGAEPADVAAVIDHVVRFAEFGCTLRDRIESMDINPLMAMPRQEGCRVADAVIFPLRE